MTFIEFARSHGLILDSVVPNRWIATSTEDHPHKSGNGRYKYQGDVGWVINWATMDKCETWISRDGTTANISQAAIKKDISERRELANKAASKAGWILHQSSLGTHNYLMRKGFGEEVGNIWVNDGKRILVIPMRIGRRLVGCQMIDTEKKFLYGQTSKGASFEMDAKGIPIYCEGYATGLSVRVAMKAMKVRYTIHVCFSASNMKLLAGENQNAIVVADNDPTGEKAARDTGRPFWISDTAGEDFNDYHMRVGLFRASQSLKQAIYDKQNASAVKTSSQSAAHAP